VIGAPIFYRIFYRMVSHRVVRRGTVREVAGAKALLRGMNRYPATPT